MRTFFCLVICLSACLPVMAESIWFVSVANIKPAKQGQYEQFMQLVTPIWKRHNMTVIIRLAVVDAYGESRFTPPHEIAVLKADSREGFRAYIDDPDYQAIKTLRTDATDFFAVLEGSNVSNVHTKNIDPLSRYPMSRIVFDTKASSSIGNLDIAITLAGQVKGTIPEFLKRVKRVRVYPLLADDNPSHFANESDDALEFVGNQLK